jgi:hypothetical protein
MQTTGLRPYLYEYMFFRAIEQTKKNIDRPIMVSQARLLRSKVEAELNLQGLNMADPKLKVQPVLSSIDKVLGENVEGYKPLFGNHTTSSQGYSQLNRDFMDMVGLDRKDAEGNVVRAMPGELGARLPISPYDPRFSTRATVKKSGSELLFVPDDMVETVVDGDPSRVHSTRRRALKLFKSTDNGKLVEAGMAFTFDDLSGLSELMGYMSEREYNSVRDWVVSGAFDGRGSYDASKYMSSAALARSVALLEELHSQGVPYTISKDRKQGQIKAQITGTRLDIRLTDTSENEQYVGRVYDDGAMVYFTVKGRRKASGPSESHNPSPQDCVKLLRYAQGRTVERSDGKGVVGSVGTHSGREWDNEAKRVVDVDHNDSYFSDNSHMALVGTVPGGGQLMIRRDARHRSSASQYFGDTESQLGVEKAEEFLRSSIESARQNLAAAIDVDGLVAAAEEHLDEYEAGTWSPDFHGDPAIASIQRGYWDVLSGRREALLKPGASEEEYEASIGVIGEMAMGGADREVVHQMLMSGITYAGSPREQVELHSRDVIDALVGQYDLHTALDKDGNEVEKRFDPVGVAGHMTSEHGVWRNNDDIVAALRALEMDTDELLGSSFYNTAIKDQMIRFDESSARPMAQVEDPFLARMHEVIEASISRNACEVSSIEIDDAGVVRYTATRMMSMKTGRDAGSNRKEIVGQIGQIFAPGAQGEIVTKFNGGDNYLFVPGYEAEIVTQKAGESLSVEERTRLRGYERIMADKISYQISSDLLTTRTEIGRPTNLNGVYRALHEVRHEVDFIERSREEGLSDEWRSAILETEGRTVRYGNEIKDGSTINADYQALQGRGSRDPSNDNYFDPYVLTGGRNMSILTQEGDGYFDPIMTSGSVNQGITRFLAESAVVNADGTITKGLPGDRTPLMKHPDAAMMEFNPFDRQQMTASNLMRASAVTEPTGTAMMTFGGWNFDDGMVVSSDFAQRYRIRGKDGGMRDLMVGDKLSDLHGNKGVISLVVDRGMDLDEAEQLGLRDAVETFRANPDLGVVMAPFSAVSRFNGGSARELMENPRELVWDEAATTGVEGGMGDVRFIVTHMAVDSKTRVYDEDDLAAGRGRKASGQLAWALNSQGADKVLAECYGANSASVSNLRELLVTMGMDIEADGTLKVGRSKHNDDDVRRVIPMPDLVLTDRGALNWRGSMEPAFGAAIGDKGGDLELPFALRYPAGEEGTAGRELGRGENGAWLLPVMSSHLRSGQDLGDGTSSVHDYTNHYLSIQEMACRYRHAEQALAAGGLSKSAEDKHRDQMGRAPLQAQQSFDAITSDIARRRFSGKYNVFKEQVMASRMPNSATAVWSADPRLDIDQLAMGPAMAESLGVQADDHVLVWRDPMLRDAGVRYMRVALDDRLTGVSINPVMDKSFDGDFDGDAVAVVKLNGRAAKLEAQQKLSVEANLLDLGQRVVIESNGQEYEVYPLMMHEALDVKVSQHQDPSLKERFDAMTLAANGIHESLQAGEIDQSEAWLARNELVGQLSDYYWEAVGTKYGSAVLRFDGAENHLESVRSACIETGAKGSEQKLNDYAYYLGVDLDEETGAWVDLGATKATHADHEAVEYATAVKSFGTGVAGKYSQRGIKALRNVSPRAVLELTYPVTQSILQSKHDPIEARKKYELLMGPVRDLWKGRSLIETRDKDGQRRWEVAKDSDGKEMQAGAADWQNSFREIYSSKDGLNVSINDAYIGEVAKALTGPDGKMVDIEDASYHGHSSPMDRLAYDGDFAALEAAAAAGENLYEGHNNAQFAPFVVRNNVKSLDAYEKAVELSQPLPEDFEITTLGRRDVQASNRGRTANRRSPLVRTAGRPAPTVVETGLQRAEELGSWSELLQRAWAGMIGHGA